MMRESYRRVGGLGFSYGGYSTAMAAARDPVFDAVALVAAPKSLFIIDHNPFIRGLSRSVPLMLRRKRRFTRLMLGLPPRRISPLGVIGRIGPPLLIIHGSEDWLIPVKHPLDLYERAPSRRSSRSSGASRRDIVATIRRAPRTAAAVLPRPLVALHCTDEGCAQRGRAAMERLRKKDADEGVVTRR